MTRLAEEYLSIKEVTYANLVKLVLVKLVLIKLVNNIINFS